MFRGGILGDSGKLLYYLGEDICYSGKSSNGKDFLEVFHVGFFKTGDVVHVFGEFFIFTFFWK
jgi:hypothetical protein